MDYKDVALFAQVVDRGSFTAAAAELGLPKSSVSRRVARLEEDLGVRLLQRTTRKLTLTDAGQGFYEHAQNAIAELEEAASAVREAGSEPRGTIRLTAPADAGHMKLGEGVAAFVRRYPSIHVELSLTSRFVDLVGEGFDIAVRAGVLPDSTLIARRVGSSDHGMFASPGYLRERGRPKVLDALSEHSCVLFRARNRSAVWKLSTPQGEKSVTVAGAVSADEMTFLRDVVIAGAGIGLLPLALAREPLRKGLLEQVLPDHRLTGAAVHVVLPSSTFIPSRVALFRDFLVEFLKREIEQAAQECQSQAGKSSASTRPTAAKADKKRSRSREARLP